VQDFMSIAFTEMRDIGYRRKRMMVSYLNDVFIFYDNCKIFKTITFSIKLLKAINSLNRLEQVGKKRIRSGLLSWSI